MDRGHREIDCHLKDVWKCSRNIPHVWFFFSSFFSPYSEKPHWNVHTSGKEQLAWQVLTFDLKACGVCKRGEWSRLRKKKKKKTEREICKIETDKVMMVRENVLFPRLRNISGDSLNGEPVYSNSMVTEMSSLLANTVHYVCAHSRIPTFILLHYCCWGYSIYISFC